ncbi:hypothetical protein ACIRQP_32940 [Streptomyces sp. NPDC102274]|uniref:hypothetical protein n=1 Tax=Streptomyces sp. NPDC102274 TaxID=3366151 RepID=UPI003829B775
MESPSAAWPSASPHSRGTGRQNFLDVPPDSKGLKQFTAALREWQITPSKGAGTRNIEDPKRIADSKKLAKEQAG